ncbi:hypothetical protein [Argonema galeatum]|uniref:hypothetical protein n=1 Tax=Argonema galeatum TaxID=2942762 RepID=UPI00201126A5|nr:hypothetical protein [Argonema galeatum]MCL1464183.1 hypothetical protein [Argonema galeatum A003/A1]
MVIKVWKILSPIINSDESSKNNYKHIMYGEALIALKASYSHFVKFELKVEDDFFGNLVKADGGKG